MSAVVVVIVGLRSVFRLEHLEPVLETVDRNDARVKGILEFGTECGVGLEVGGESGSENKTVNGLWKRPRANKSPMIAARNVLTALSSVPCYDGGSHSKNGKEAPCQDSWVVAS
ncbi:hypothetical protein Ddc_12216 [Ditylenchus destructor]|nr:hypothetical protein Ddc_12216 [Ditylenchus destructor]